MTHPHATNAARIKGAFGARGCQKITAVERCFVLYAAVARAQAKSLPLGPLGFQQAAKRNARQRFSSRHIRARKRVFLSTLLLHWFAKTPPAGLHWNERFYGCVAPQIRSAFARLRSPQVCL